MLRPRIITGTLPAICHAQAFTRELNRHRLRIFGFTRFAEERAGQLERLRHTGAGYVRDDAQGSLFARPLEPADAEALLPRRFAEAPRMAAAPAPAA